MSKKQFVILLLAVIFSAFLGGAVVQYFGLGETAIAKEPDVGKFDEIRTKTLYLVGKDNEIKASFYLDIHDSPQLILYDKNGTNRFNFGLAPAGNAGLSLNDGNFNKLISIDTSHDNASIEIKDVGKNVIWKAP